MKWTNHSKLSTYGVQLRGWPASVPSQNPSTLTVAQNKLLLDLLRERHIYFVRTTSTQGSSPETSAETGGEVLQNADTMFEDTIEEELVKYEKFRADITEGGKKQDELLEQLRVRMKEFLASRSHEPAVKEREAALQELDLAYHKYHDITRHLDEGHQVRLECHPRELHD